MIVRFTESYTRAMARHGIVAGTPMSRAVARVVRELEAAEKLPLPGDTKLIMPPALEAWARAVPATSFRVVYVINELDVTLFTIHLR